MFQKTNTKIFMKSGFSLVELLVVMGITLMMAGMVFALNAKSVAPQDVESASQQVSAQLRSLQNEALTGKMVKDSGGNFVSACRFIFKANSSNSTYSVIYDKNCSGATVDQIGEPLVVDLQKKRVKFDADHTIIFSSPRGETGSEEEIILISDRNTSIKKYINTSSSGSVQVASMSLVTTAPCDLPWGGTLAHGSSVTANQTDTVACGSVCAAETRTCNNGVLSGSYTKQSCSASMCASCTLPWGGTILSGTSADAFAATSVTCGTLCSDVKQTRTCNNGVLSGSYTGQNCSEAACASCTLPWGGTIASGASVSASQTSTVACGSTCATQTRTCNNGSLSGTYTNQSCSVAVCPTCSDGIQNGTETGVDCGGSCGACAALTWQIVNQWTDYATGWCTEGSFTPILGTSCSPAGSTTTDGVSDCSDNGDGSYCCTVAADYRCQ